MTSFTSIGISIVVLILRGAIESAIRGGDLVRGAVASILLVLNLSSFLVADSSMAGSANVD